MNTLNRHDQTHQLAAQLDAEHLRLEQWFLDLTDRAATGEPRECDAVWSDFARQLESHMSFEEREIFPRYAHRNGVERRTVAELAEEHAAIRKQVEDIGVDLQLHLTNAEVIAALLKSLREHARHERETLYRWLTGPEPGQHVAQAS